jgi:hypothetical protein
MIDLVELDRLKRILLLYRLGRPSRQADRSSERAGRYRRLALVRNSPVRSVGPLDLDGLTTAYLWSVFVATAAASFYEATGWRRTGRTRMLDLDQPRTVELWTKALA